MNVYVETNFVLELAFEQEQHASCKEILDICDRGAARLVLPAYCLAEPHEKLTRQSLRRLELQRNLLIERQQLVRTESYAARIAGLDEVAGLLAQINQDEKQRFGECRDRLLAVAESVPLSADILRDAAANEATYYLSPQDSIVFSSVMAHLRDQGSQPSCFLNRNTKDFGNPDIVNELKAFDCAMIPTFAGGLGFVNSRLSP